MESFSLIIRLVCVVMFVTLAIGHFRNSNKGEDMSNYDLLLMIMLLFGAYD